MHFFLFHKYLAALFSRRSTEDVLLPKNTHVPVGRKETPVEVSRHGEEFLLCAGLWEFTASHLKVLYKMSTVLMSWPSGIFQGWDFPFVLLFC